MSKLEDLKPGLHVAGVISGQNITIVAVQPHGPDAVELTYKTPAGRLEQRVLDRAAETGFEIAEAQARPLDAEASDFKLVAECQRIKLASLSDPLMAVTTSDIQPLPHQLRAVYGELLKQLQPDKYALDFKKVSDEVLGPLCAIPGIELKVSIEIEAVAPDGFEENKVRTIRENAGTLKFEQHEFADE